MSATWKSECGKCGASNSCKIGTTGPKPSKAPNAISGKCPSSSDGKHKPKWVPA